MVKKPNISNVCIYQLIYISYTQLGTSSQPGTIKFDMKLGLISQVKSKILKPLIFYQVNLLDVIVHACRIIPNLRLNISQDDDI